MEPLDDVYAQAQDLAPFSGVPGPTGLPSAELTSAWVRREHGSDRVAPPPEPEPPEPEPPDPADVPPTLAGTPLASVGKVDPPDDVLVVHAAASSATKPIRQDPARLRATALMGCARGRSSPRPPSPHR